MYCRCGNYRGEVNRANYIGLRGGVETHQLHDESLFFLGPSLLAHRRAEVVVPPVTSLLAKARPRQLRGNLGPVPRPQRRHKLCV